MSADARLWFEARPRYSLEWLDGGMLKVHVNGSWAGTFNAGTRAASLEMARDHFLNVEAEEAGA